MINRLSGPSSFNVDSLGTQVPRDEIDGIVGISEHRMKKTMSFIAIAPLAVSCALLSIATVAHTQRLMTNEDVTNLISARMAETVILQAIDTSQAKFDTSADALIVLKQKGATDSIIQHILAKSSTAPAPATGGGCSDGFNASLAVNDGGNSVVLRQAATSFDFAGGAGTIASGIGSIFTFGLVPTTAPMRLTVEGVRAKARFARSPTDFIFKNPQFPAAPEQEIFLVKLTVDSEKRTLIVGEASTGLQGTRMPFKLPPDVVVATDVSKSEKTCTFFGGQSASLQTIKAQPKTPLSPGEYAIVTTSGRQLFDFGIDAE